MNILKPLRFLILACIVAAAIASRLFSIVKFESIIHEFDPWFNYRASQILVQDGFYAFWDWFDSRSWYPLGREVGGTVFPGLMITSGLFKKFFDLINLDIDIKELCVFFAPAFAPITAIVIYLLTSILSDEIAGFFAASFMAIAPGLYSFDINSNGQGYIQRSVAGSYDNEAIAITLLVSTFYLWTRAIMQGSVSLGSITGLFYFWMVASWGTIASMMIPVVGYKPIQTSEHMAALGVFGLLQLIAFADFIRAQKRSQQLWSLLVKIIFVCAVLGVLVIAILTKKEIIAPWTGRFYSLWDTSYASKNIPIIASVSEHQPPTWLTFALDLNMLVWLLPPGLYFCFQELKNEHVFYILYAVFACYFSGVMNRLLLTLTPCLCILGGIAMSKALQSILNSSTRTAPNVLLTAKSARKESPVNKKRSKAKTSKLETTNLQQFAKVFTTFYFLSILLLYVYHCTWMNFANYSSPSVVLSGVYSDGSQFIIDDFREAYYWLRENTDYDAKVLSWWDYGYQIAGMADRSTIVDNNTWNFTHIALVAKIFASDEDKAYEMAQELDVDYVLVMFGGLIRYSGDDINKFLWIIRIAQGLWPDEIKEKDFYSESGDYRVDHYASKAMKDSLLYKLSYKNYADIFPDGVGQDRVRNQNVEKDIELYNFEEAFTSENWMVRIFKVKPKDFLQRSHKQVVKFAASNGS